MYSRTETQWWSPANVSSQRVAGLTGREGFACHEPATLSYYTSLPVFVTSVYRYVALLNMRQPPLSLSLFIIPPFLSRRSVIIGYVYIYIRYRSAEFPRLISTTLGSEKWKERRWKSEKKATREPYLEISMDGNLIFFFSSFSLFPLCSIPVKLSRPLFNRGPNENKAG